ncbi:MAG: DUF6261 family protein, partial [Cytophagales bacterium]
RLRNPEYFQYSSDVVTIIASANPVTLEIDKPFQAFKASTAVLESLFKSDRGSSITDEIIQLDARRDRAINGILLYVEGLTNHFDEQMSKNATLIFDYINSYGSGIARQNYPTETATLTTIINDWNNKKPLADAIAMLNLAAWKNELNEANNAFNAKYIDRTKETGAENDDKMKEKRQESMVAYSKLKSVIESYFTIKDNLGDDTTGYAQLIKNINALSEKYNVLLAGRSKKAE